MKRNGKIARLPEEIREQLNDRLEAGEEGPALLDWLNAQPETVEVMREVFDGVPVSKQNLSEWRKGGHAEWLLRRSLVESATALSERVQDVQETVGELLVDDVATELTTRYAALLAGWDGQPSPEFEAKARLLRILCRDVVQLQRATHAAIARNEERERLEIEEDEKEFAAEKKRAMAPLYETMRKYMTGNYKTPTDKIAALIRAVENGSPMPKFDTPDAPGQAQSNPVKPISPD